MVEGLENAKYLSENKHHVDGQDHGSVHEIDEEPPPAEAPQDLVRRPRRFSNGKPSNVKRSSMRSPNRGKHRPTSMLRFSAEVVSMDGDNNIERIPSAPFLET